MHGAPRGGYEHIANRKTAHKRYKQTLKISHDSDTKNALLLPY